MNSIVSIDIETTALDQNREAVFEIRAFEIKDNRIEVESSSLINPNRHVSGSITTLPGMEYNLRFD